jgi:CRP/FNR family transcriptional regulator, cyclic AMP receptor protein
MPLDAPETSFYGALSRDGRARLREEAVAVRAFEAGRMLMSEEQPAGGATPVMTLLGGWAKATTFTAAGDQVVLRVYGPGDLLGAEAALPPRPQPRSETVIALTACTALLVPAARFADLLDRNPAIARACSVAMLHRARAADEHAKLRHGDPRFLLARILLDLACRAYAGGADGITIPADLTQDDLASMAGVSRSTITRTLQSLRQADVLQTGYRTITITDIDGMRRIATHMPVVGPPPRWRVYDALSEELARVLQAGHAPDEVLEHVNATDRNRNR